MPTPRNCAIAIVACGQIKSICQRYLSAPEALSFAEAYNRVDEDRQAVVVLHPISRAICRAKSRSRAS